MVHSSWVGEHLLFGLTFADPFSPRQDKTIPKLIIYKNPARERLNSTVCSLLLEANIIMTIPSVIFIPSECLEHSDASCTCIRNHNDRSQRSIRCSKRNRDGCTLLDMALALDASTHSTRWESQSRSGSRAPSRPRRYASTEKVRAERPYHNRHPSNCASEVATAPPRLPCRCVGCDDESSYSR